MKILGIAGLPGGMEVVLIIFVIILLFGARKLPELARSLGTVSYTHLTLPTICSV